MSRPEVIKTPLGERLRAVRAAFGDPDRESFCLRLGISRGSLANYERGDRVPDAGVLSAYRSSCGVNLNWLLSAEGEMFGSLENPHEQSQIQITPHSPDENNNSIEERNLDMELFPRILDAVSRAYKYEDIKISMIDIGEISVEYFNDILEAFNKAHTPLTREAIIPVAWLLTAWVRRDLRKPAATQGQTKREASGS